jgi:hypothetical protein
MGRPVRTNKEARVELRVPAIPRELTEAQVPAGIEYIKAQLEYARDDSRQVYLRVTAALAVAGLVLTQLPFARLRALEDAPKVALAAGIGALVLAAVFHHLYLTRIHHSRLEIAACLPGVHAYEASQFGPPRWERYVWLLHAGDVLMAVGAVCLGVALAVMLF